MNKKFNIGDATRTHGRSHTRLYHLWASMRYRCTDGKHHAFRHYGARGITVCERWQKFENFAADMGERPSGMSLDRIDPNGPYSPENCRWATYKEQARKTRRNKYIEINGEVRCLSAWLEHFGLSHATYKTRRYSGLDEVTALTKPVRFGVCLGPDSEVQG